MNKKQIKYITLCYGVDGLGKVQHLIRMKNGKGLLRTTPQMRRMGLIKMRGGRTHA